MNILLLEDDELLGEVTSALLLGQGHVAVIATTVQQAAALLTAPNDFGAVLLDLSVGKDRGDDLIRRLRNEGCKLPPVIIFSGESKADLRRSAEAISAAAILQKPCNSTDLASAIHGAVSRPEKG
jgi:DNA-binding response OmpR family regulator